MNIDRHSNKFENHGKDGNIFIQIERGRSKESLPKSTLLPFRPSDLGKTSQFLCCSVGVFVFYLIYGYLLELIFTLEGLKPFGWFITLTQFGYYSIFGWAETILSGVRERKIPIKIYLLLAALTVGTVGFSNTSLKYLNYPTQVMFKCCKLIPVMLGGIFIQKKIYGILDFTAAFLMCIGLAWFTLADSYLVPSFDILGIFMISLALLCDAVIGNVQEKAMNKYSVPNTEVILYSYSLGFTYLLIALIFTGEFFSGFSFFLQNPLETYGYGLLFSISGYFGIKIVLILVKTYGALAAVTVTTCRKAISIALSFIFFSKPFSIDYFWSGLLVIMGIYLNIYAKKFRNFNLLEVVLKCFKIIIKVKNFKKKKSTHELTV